MNWAGGTKSAWPSKNAPVSRPTHSREWKPACVFPAHKRSRRKFSAGYRGGKTGFSSAPPQPASTEPSNYSAPKPSRNSIGRESNGAELSRSHSEQCRTRLKSHFAARPRTLATGIHALVAGSRPHRFSGLRCLSAHRDFGGYKRLGHIRLRAHARISLGNFSSGPRERPPHRIRR